MADASSSVVTTPHAQCAVHTKGHITALKFRMFICCFLILCHCITCFQCNSEYDPRCGDPFDPYSLGEVNCSMKDAPEHIDDKTAVVCRKMKQKIYGKTRIVRGCGYIEDDPPRSDCAKRSGTHDVQVLYCACKGDLCNAGTSVQPSSYLLTATAVIAVAAAVASSYSSSSSSSSSL